VSFIGTLRAKSPGLVAAIAIMVAGPILGIGVGLFFGALALRADPNFTANGQHAAPGDGIVIMIYIFASFASSIPLSISLALLVLIRKAKMKSPANPTLGAASPPYLGQ
jgi:hypothetical protein